MKALALLPIAGALCLYGSAFTELWTPPGLEDMPTYRNVLEVASLGEPEETEEEIVLEPKNEIIPLSESHRFRPEGVVSNWGGDPVIDLTKLTPEEVERARTSASTLAHYRATAPKGREYKDKTTTKYTPPAPRPDTSYILAGHKTRIYLEGED